LGGWARDDVHFIRGLILFTNCIWTVGPALVAAPWHADQRRPYKSLNAKWNWYHKRHRERSIDGRLELNEILGLFSGVVP
jgi:hypothetical protein